MGVQNTPDRHTSGGRNFKGEMGPAWDMLGHDRRSIYSKRLSRGQHRYGADTDWGELGGVHVGAHAE